MRLFHLYHHNRLYKTIHSDFWLFELSVWVHTVALSLISIFIPILILDLGYSLGQVIYYYLIFNVFDVPLNFVAQWLVTKIGARKVVILGTVAAIFFFITLSQLSEGWGMLIILALFAALYDAFYWVAHLFLFIEANDDDGDSGKETSILYIARKVGGLLGPAGGAVILVFANEAVLISATVVIFLISILPLLKASHLPDKPSKPVPGFRKFFGGLTEKKNYISLAFFSAHSNAESVIWPLFIFVIFGSLGSVAAVPIIISITSIMFAYLTGKIDKKNRDGMMMLGAAVIAIVWVLRLALSGAMFLYVSIFLVGLFSLLISIPLDSAIFERAKESEPLSAATYRNTFSMFVNVIFYLILALLVNVFQISFVVAAISMLLLVVVNYVFIQVSRRQDETIYQN